MKQAGLPNSSPIRSKTPVFDPTASIFLTSTEIMRARFNTEREKFLKSAATISRQKELRLKTEETNRAQIRKYEEKLIKIEQKNAEKAVELEKITQKRSENRQKHILAKDKIEKMI